MHNYTVNAQIKLQYTYKKAQVMLYSVHKFTLLHRRLSMSIPLGGCLGTEYVQSNRYVYLCKAVGAEAKARMSGMS